MEKTLLTKQGLVDLKIELELLLTTTRLEVIEELQAAREQGDLSENADYDAAREKQGQIEGKIRELQFVLDNHTIIEADARKTTGITVGQIVTIKNMSNKKEESFSIVGSFEVNPFENKISNDSPLAKALLGSSVGDTVNVKSIEPYKAKILKVKNIK